jgi:hypothetical protein
MPGLLELQRAFAAGLRDQPHDADAWADSDGISATARLRVYRNTARASFERALEVTFPVVHDRVGPDYFRQLTHFYRRAHPSRAGDLHEIGRRFPGFLGSQLTGGAYAWLAELATLEWAVAEAGVAADATTAPASSLAGLAPESVPGARLRFVPSLQRVSARVPILSVWRASQSQAERPVVDLDSGPEHVLVHRATDGVQLRGLQADEFAFVDAIASGASLEAAVDAAALPLERLPALLFALFTDEAVAEIIPPPAPGLPRDPTH